MADKDDLWCLARRWKTKECYDAAKHLKWTLEALETLDWQLAELQDADPDSEEPV